MNRLKIKRAQQRSGTRSGASRVKAATPIAERIRNSKWLLLGEVFVMLLAFVGIVFTVYQTGLTLDEIEENSIDREADLVARSWSNLIARAPGNSGKTEAIQALVKRGYAVSGVDLRCFSSVEFLGDASRPMFEPVVRPILEWPAGAPVLEETPGPNHHEEPSTTRSFDCASGVYLRGLSLSSSDEAIAFSGANLTGADLQGANFQNVDFRETVFTGSDLEGAVFSGGSLSDAKLDHSLGFPSYVDVDVSGASFIGAEIGAISLIRRPQTDEIDGNPLPESLVGSTIRELSFPIWARFDAPGHHGQLRFDLDLSETTIHRLVANRSQALPAITASGTHIRSAAISAAPVILSIEGSRLENVDFGNSDLWGGLSNVRCLGCNFSGVNFAEFTFENVEVSGSIFCSEDGCASGITQEHLNGMFITRENSHRFYRSDLFPAGAMFRHEVALNDRDTELVHIVRMENGAEAKVPLVCNDPRFTGGNPLDSNDYDDFDPYAQVTFDLDQMECFEQ